MALQSEVWGVSLFCGAYVVVKIKVPVTVPGWESWINFSEFGSAVLSASESWGTSLNCIKTHFRQEFRVYCNSFRNPQWEDLTRSNILCGELSSQSLSLEIMEEAKAYHDKVYNYTSGKWYRKFGKIDFQSSCEFSPNLTSLYLVE